jgi:hypothetical protein
MVATVTRSPLATIATAQPQPGRSGAALGARGSLILASHGRSPALLDMILLVHACLRPWHHFPSENAGVAEHAK